MNRVGKYLCDLSAMSRGFLLLAATSYRRIQINVTLIWFDCDRRYLFFRNCCASVRAKHLVLLAGMGKITLETYLLQHHIWLTSNAKSLLILVCLFCFCVHVLAARQTTHVYMSPGVCSLP